MAAVMWMSAAAAVITWIRHGDSRNLGILLMVVFWAAVYTWCAFKWPPIGRNRPDAVTAKSASETTDKATDNPTTP